MANVLGILASVFGAIGGGVTLAVELLGRFGVAFFLLGFFGLLATFLWFFFRYLDRRRLALPAVFFMLSFLIFLGGNILMLVHDSHTQDTVAPVETVQTESVSGTAV